MASVEPHVPTAAFAERTRDESLGDSDWCVELLSQFGINLLKVRTPQGLFKVMADHIAKATTNTFVIISEFELPSYAVTIREGRTSREFEAQIKQLMNHSLQGLSFPFSDEARTTILPGKLAFLPGGIHELTFGQIPETISRVLEQEFQISEVHAMAMLWERDILGTVSLLVHGGGHLRSRRVIELMVSEGALALQKVRAEQSMLETKDRYKALFDHANEGIILADAKGKILLVNEKLSEMSGFSREELIGHSIFEFVSKEDTNDVRQNIRMRQLGKQSQYDIRIHKKNRDFAWVHISGTPIFDASGRFVGNLGLLLDVTERKMIEEEMRQLIEYSPTAIFTIDFSTYKFSKVNEAMSSLLGYTREELLSMGPFDILDDHYRRLFQERLEKAREGKPVASHVEYQVTDKAGRLHWAELDVTFQKKDGKIIGESVIAHDITFRKQYEQALKESNRLLQKRTDELANANKELESFSYSVSHDLKAPLRSINGFSEAIYEDYYEALDDAGKEYLTRIRDSTKKMSKLIDDILRLSRVTRANIHFGPVNLSSLAQHVTRDLQKANPSRAVEVHIEDNLVSTGDAPLLEILLHDLLSNAFKFTDKQPHPRIDIGATEQEGQKVFFVKDNGVGFDMAYADKLFIAFQRLHTEKEYTGTGIGLAIASRIVRRHGGKIWADAKPGQGATFYFTLT